MTDMYAVVKVGGTQHKVAEGDTLTVDRMPDAEGAKVALEPVMFRGDDAVFDVDGLKKVKVEAIVQGHERGPKIRVFKFKPKSGYKKTKGHRSELTRIKISSISFTGAKTAAKAKPAAAKAEKPAATEAKAQPKAKANKSGEADGS